MTPTLTMAWFAVSLTALVFVTRWFGLRVQALVQRLTGNADAALYVYFFLLLPGTLAHEFSHWLMAKLLGLRTGKFSVRPQQKRGNVVQFGGVQIEPGGALRESLVGLAPLLMGTALVLWLARARLGLSPRDVWTLAELPARIGGAFQRPDAWLWLYLAMAVSNAMLPSASDWRGWRVVGEYGLLILAVLYGAGLLARVPTDVWSGILRLVDGLAFTFSLTLVFDGLIGGLFWALEVLIKKIQED